MSDEDPTDDGVTALMRRIDHLLGEAAQLREEVTSAVRARVERPFWPDRRHTSVPHEPERRAR